MVQQIHTVTARRTVLLLLAAAVEPAGAVDCTADVAFNNVFARNNPATFPARVLRLKKKRRGARVRINIKNLATGRPRRAARNGERWRGARKAN